MGNDISPWTPQKIKDTHKSSGNFSEISRTFRCFFIFALKARIRGALARKAWKRAKTEKPG